MGNSPSKAPENVIETNLIQWNKDKVTDSEGPVVYQQAPAVQPVAAVAQPPAECPMSKEGQVVQPPPECPMHQKAVVQPPPECPMHQEATVSDDVVY